MRRKPSVGIAYISPLLFGVLLLAVYPLVQVVWMSFHRIRLANIQDAAFVGLENFVTLFRIEAPAFGSVVAITLIFVVASVFFHVAIGFVLALFLNCRWMKGHNVLRGVYMMPWITAGIMVGYTWSFLLEPRAGILNYLLSLLELPAQSWTADRSLALPAIIIANIWRGVPYSLIILTGGLQSIDPELYDSALVDGAKSRQIVRFITLPLMREFILLNLILDTGLTFHVFDVIFAMTAGGPRHSTTTLAILMYNRAFRFGEIGLGSAVAVMLLLISGVLAVFYIRSMRRERGMSHVR